MSDLISRQDAIDVLEERLRANGYSNVGLVSELNRSIGYIMKLPSAQPDTCDYWDSESNYCTLNKPSAQPTIDAVEVVHGSWEKYLNEGLLWRCSICGSRINAPYHYCPNCGAKMDGEEKADELM